MRIHRKKPNSMWSIIKKKKKTYPVLSLVCVAKFKTLQHFDMRKNANWHVLFFPMKVSWGKADTAQCAASDQRARDKKKSTVSANTHFIQPTSTFPYHDTLTGKRERPCGRRVAGFQARSWGNPLRWVRWENSDQRSIVGSCFYLCSVQTNNQLRSQVNNTLKQWHQKKFLQKGIIEQEFLDEF